MTVGITSIVFMFISLFLTAGIFVGLFLVFKLKYHQSWKVFVAGCLTFLVSALVLEQILHAIVLSTPLASPLTGNIWLYALYGACAASLFEETGRLVTMKFFLKKHHENPAAGIMFGAGHGGFEAVAILGVTMISNIAMAFMINSGSIAAAFTGLDAAKEAALNAQITTLVGTTPAMYLLGIVERIFAITGHIAMSMFMWRGITRRRSLCVLLAYATHFVLDFASVTINAAMGPVATEIALAVISLAMICGAAVLYRKEY